ncbi:DUF4160 domain-containing protein [Desulfonatronospira sp.]|uniref:DUF4160 domain-containing protein n=1 Tax=Desulfonatronospira sp. TaxID=1962951 RepID=UPI0025BE487A|nr:DUF4160 domain-containing protein [Desulfonatronospira sp.]
MWADRGEYGSEKVAIEIETLRILEGHLAPRALGLVIEWASQHRDELIQNWELARNNQAPRKIEPLK